MTVCIVVDERDSCYRIYSVLSYIVVLIVIGLPVWWMTTRVYRAPLPLDKISNVEFSNNTQKQLGVPLSLEYDILITMINPDSDHLEVNLDGELLDLNLQPFIESLSPVADFVVKTQWLFMVELGVTPKKVGDHFAIYENQLPNIITPLETKFWSHLSPRPSINLVLYIPSCKAPLHIYDRLNNKLSSNALLSSGWGAVTILNPDRKSCENGVYNPKLETVVPLFIQQLQVTTLCTVLQ